MHTLLLVAALLTVVAHPLMQNLPRAVGSMCSVAMYESLAWAQCSPSAQDTSSGLEKGQLGVRAKEPETNSFII